MSFLNPALLWAGLLSAPLILFYLLRARRTDQRVPSTLLWLAALQDVEARVPFRRLKNNWLLLIQLLTLALLVIAAAGPHCRPMVAPGGAGAIIIDCSASMKAEGRFEKAKRAAEHLIDTLANGRDHAAIVRATSEAEIVASLSSDTRGLREALGKLETASTSVDLSAALHLARNVTGPDSQIVLITDGASPLPVSGNYRVISVGSSAPNAGIVAMGVRPRDSSGADNDVFVAVRNASQRYLAGTIECRVDGQLADAVEIAIEPEGEASRSLRLIGVHDGAIEVALVHDAPDSLAIDDRVYWNLRPPRTRLCSVDAAADDYIRRAIAACEEWQVKDLGGAGESDLEVVCGREPSASGPPFLWLMPEEGRTGTVEEGSALVRWERAHPALRFVDLAPVRFGRLPRYERLSGTCVLAETSAGPFIMESTIHGRRCLIWAFNPLESDLPLRAAFPLLVKNSLDYLAPAAGGIPGGVPAGSGHDLAWETIELVRFRSPAGTSQAAAARSGKLRLPPFGDVGFWEVAGSTRTERIGVSLLDRVETDLRPRFEASTEIVSRMAAAGGESPDSAVPPRSAQGWLGAAALLLLLFECYAYNRRWMQ